MIPKLENAAKNLVTPSWKPSTDTSVSPTTSDFTPADTPTKSSSSNHQSTEDLDATKMEETTGCPTSKQGDKAPESEDLKAEKDASLPRPEGPSTSKESMSTNPKAKRATCKKHAKDSKKKTKKRSKAVEPDSSSDSDDSSSDSSSSSSSSDSSDSSSEEDEAAKKKRKSKAKKAKKLKAKKRAKAKAKAEETDSDSDDESSSSEEEKKKNKRKKQLKRKKRAKKSREVEEDDDEEEDDDDEDGDAAINRQKLAQLQAMSLKRVGRGRVGRGSIGETVSISGELGKTSAKAKAKPGKRSVFRDLPDIKSPKSGSAALVPCKFSHREGIRPKNAERFAPIIETLL